MHNETPAGSDQVDQCFFCNSSPLFLPVTLGYIVVCAPAQLGVLFLMTRAPDFGTDKMDVFHFHLVLTEVIFALLVPPTVAATYAGSIVSTLMVLTLGEVLVVMRIELQSIICLEHYLAVVHPVRYLHYRTLRKRLVLSGLAAAQTVVLVGVMMGICSLTFKKNLYTSVFVSTFCWNTSLGVVVLRVLRRSSPGRNQAKRRAFNIVLIYLLVTYISYTPMMVALVLLDFLGLDLMCVLHPPAYCLMLWLGVVSPLLYLRRAAKHFFLK